MYLQQGLFGCRNAEGHSDLVWKVHHLIPESIEYGMSNGLLIRPRAGREYWGRGVATVINQVLVHDDAD